MSKRSLFDHVALAIAAAGALGIAALQPGLAKNVHKVRQRDDVFLLPPPAELRAMTLGYRAATADYLWSQLVLEYSLHWQEKRAFPDVYRYVDGILALEPDFKTLYLYVDTILCYAPPTTGTIEDVRATRRYLERGTKERPFDQEIWLHYGQFMAFMAPTWMTDEAEIDAWRKDGALAIARAVELGADPDRSLAASTILTKAGESKTTIRHLEHAYALADDPETRRQLLLKLQKLNASLDSEQAVSRVERDMQLHYPHLTKGQTLLIGPFRKPSACAGGRLAYELKRCPADWTEAIENPR